MKPKEVSPGYEEVPVVHLRQGRFSPIVPSMHAGISPTPTPSCAEIFVRKENLALKRSEGNILKQISSSGLSFATLCLKFLEDPKTVAVSFVYQNICFALYRAMESGSQQHILSSASEPFSGQVLLKLRPKWSGPGGGWEEVG